MNEIASYLKPNNFKNLQIEAISNEILSSNEIVQDATLNHKELNCHHRRREFYRWFIYQQIPIYSQNIKSHSYQRYPRFSAKRLFRESQRHIR